MKIEVWFNLSVGDILTQYIAKNLWQALSKVNAQYDLYMPDVHFLGNMR